MNTPRHKSDAIKLFVFLCVVFLSLLVFVITQRGWFRTHLPSDRIGLSHDVGYGQYFTESSLYDQVVLWLFIGSPMLAGMIAWAYIKYFKVKL